MTVGPLNNLLKLAALVVGAEVGVNTPWLDPVVRDDANVAMAHQRLPQHLDAVVNVCTDHRLAVCEAQRPVFWSVIVLAIRVLADEVLQRRDRSAQY